MDKLFGLISKIFKNKYFVEILLSLLFFWGFLVRLYKINNPIADWHSFRQADTASVTVEYLKNGINIFVPRYHDLSRVQSGLLNLNGYRFVEFPIYNAMHFYLVKLLPGLTIEVCGRLLSIIFSMITGIILYKITKLLFDKSIAAVAFVIYLFLPYNIYFSRVILPDPLAVMFAVIGLWFNFKFQKTEKITHLVLFSIFTSLGLLVKPYVIFYSIPFYIYLIKKYQLKAIFNRDNIISFLIIFLPFILWRIWMQKFPEGIPFWKWTFNGDGIRFRPAFWRWIFGERIGHLILGSWGLIPFVFGIISLAKKDFILKILLISMFLYLAVFATANVRHDYYQIIIIPILIIMVAKGVSVLWNLDNFNKIITRTVLITSIIFAFIVTYSQVREFYNINHWEIIEAGKFADRILPKHAIVIAPYNGDTAFLYQTKRKGWPVVERPIKELIDEGAEYYISVNYDKQTREFMEQFKTIEVNEKFVILDLNAKKLI